MSDPNQDPMGQEVSAAELQPLLDWLQTGQLHFQLTDNANPAADAAQRLYAGFLAIPQPSKDERPAPGTAISLVGDGVGITPAPPGRASFNPAGATCSV